MRTTPEWQTRRERQPELELMDAEQASLNRRGVVPCGVVPCAQDAAGTTVHKSIQIGAKLELPVLAGTGLFFLFAAGHMSVNCPLWIFC